MAGVNSKTQCQDFDLTMTCCLGDHPLHNPKLLPCQHSFCSGCLKAKLKDEKIFVCPKCQLSVPLTEKEVDNLPEDVLCSIIQGSKVKSSHCVPCGFDEKKTPGTFQCLDCADVLCNECKPWHTKFSHARSHKVVPLKDVKEGKYKTELQAAKQLLCDIHSNPNKPMLLEYYCDVCNCLACHKCAITQHLPKGHACKTIDEIHGEKATNVKDNLTKLMDVTFILSEFMSILDQVKGQNKVKKEELENTVHERAAKFIEIVEKVKDELLKKIRGHFDTEDNEIQTKFDDVKNRKNRIESLVGYTQAFLEHSTKSEFLKYEKELMTKITDQNEQKIEKTFERKEMSIGEANFDATKEFITKAFGEIKVEIKKEKNQCSEVLSSELMKEPKVLFDVSSGMDCMYDLTVTENGDIVAVYGSTIQVYNSEGRPTRKIQYGLLQDAWNVVAKSDTLYVSSCIWVRTIQVLDFDGNVKKTITLPKGQNYGHKGLAVDDEGNVYISSFNKHTVYKCGHNETNAIFFISQGKHQHLNQPWYLCVTPGGDIVVSNYGSNRIQLYDRQGNFMWQYKGQGDMAVKQPRGVCCDREGHIYITDCKSHRIQLIRDGNLLKCIEINGFQSPYCIALDNDNHIVCGYQQGQKIMKIKV